MKQTPIIIIVIVVLLVLVGFFVWRGNAGPDSPGHNATSTGDSATSTATSSPRATSTNAATSTTDETGKQGGSGNGSKGDDTFATVNWQQYAGADTYEYQHIERGYTVQVPTKWGYFDVSEDDEPMNAWFFPSDTRELSAANRTQLKESTDARVRIVTNSKLPIGGEDRMHTLSTFTGDKQETDLPLGSSALLDVRRGDLDPDKKGVDGFSYSFLRPEGDGFIVIDGVYKTPEGKRMIEEFIYSFAQTYQP